MSWALGRFCTAEEAAHAYDDAVREAGRRVVNFLRPKSNEVQAVKDEEDKTTLKRHAAEQAAAGAGAAGGITPHGMPAPSMKRHAAAPPPSEPSRKRAAAGVETPAPAAVKTESPAAPSPARYTRRPPHRIDAAAWPPPAGEEEPCLMRRASRQRRRALPPRPSRLQPRRRRDTRVARRIASMQPRGRRQLVRNRLALMRLRRASSPSRLELRRQHPRACPAGHRLRHDDDPKTVSF